MVTGLDNFQATDQGDVGGQHPRAAPAFMSCVHPKQTEGSDVQAGTTIDQMIAAQICRDTKLPSLEVSVDRNDVVGACDHGYACAYMNSMSWASPTNPLPSETNPRFVFERMFGVGSTAEERLARGRRRVAEADIQVPACLISAALQTYRRNVSDPPHCRRIRTFMLTAWLRGARLTALLTPT